VATARSHAFKTRTIRRELGVVPETLQNMDVLDEPTGKYLRRVSGATPNFRRIPDRILKDQCQPNAGLRVPSPETRCKPIHGALGRRHGPGQLLDRVRSHLLPVGSQSQGKVPASQLEVSGFWLWIYASIWLFTALRRARFLLELRIWRPVRRLFLRRL